MTARSTVLRLTFLALLLARSPRWVRTMLKWMLVGTILTVAAILLSVSARSEQPPDRVLNEAVIRKLCPDPNKRCKARDNPDFYKDADPAFYNRITKPSRDVPPHSEGKQSRAACIREMRETFAMGAKQAKRVCDPRSAVKPHEYGWECQVDGPKEEGPYPKFSKVKGAGARLKRDALCE